MLHQFYGKDNVFVTGSPQYSFFNNRGNLYSLEYINALDKNQMLRHTNFNTNNYKYEPEQISSEYILNLNKILH